MSGFRFNLERVLHWRALELAMEEGKLKRLMHEKMLLESELQDLRISIARNASRIAALEEITGLDLSGMAGHASYVRKQLARIGELCREKQRLIGEQAEIHRQAKQRHGLLEELRERRHKEWERQESSEIETLAQESYLARWKPSGTRAQPSAAAGPASEGCNELTFPV